MISKPAITARDPRTGTSLVEMMIAISILGIGILAAASSQLTAMKFTTESQRRTDAYYLAAQQMEAFHSMTAEEVQDIADLGSYPNDVDNNPIDPDPDDGRTRAYNRSWNIQADTPEDGLYTISVIVGWQVGSGPQRNITVESIKAGS
jgi:prepilin-type N-terminal cleavage/methylation domain-containing protein